jgi:RNA polymerase sigma-70 factor (TIGR02943 family)
MTMPAQNFAAQLADLRPQLLRFAQLQLRHATWAEEAVSETILAVMSNPQGFRGQSQFKTWVIGILKHKIVDLLRKSSRECSLEAMQERHAGIESDVFAEDGHFREPVSDWGHPERSLEQAQFMGVLEACLEHLPTSLARVFLMREWLELSTEQICQDLAINPTNLWVMLHRARLRLRECLNVRWFGQSAVAGLTHQSPDVKKKSR